MSAQSRVEEILENILGELDYLPTPQSRVEELLVLLKDTIDSGGGGGSSSSTYVTNGLRLLFTGDVATGSLTDITSASIPMSDSWTMECAFTVDEEHTTNGRAVEFYNGAINSIACNGTRNKALEVAINGTWFTSDLPTMTAGELHTVTLVSYKDGDTRKVEVYYDGSLTKHLQDAPNRDANLIAIYFRHGSTSRRTLNGTLYSTRFYTRELTAEEVAANRAVDEKAFKV